MHFTQDSSINTPHFLKLILDKMARGVKYESKKPETSLYHHSLIKILIVAELSKRNNSSEDLLIENLPGEETQVKWR